MGVRRANPPTRKARNKQFLLGIEISDVDLMRREARTKLFDEARLPRVVEQQWDSLLSSRSTPSLDIDLSITLDLVREYAKAISHSASQLADWLVTAAITLAPKTQFNAALRETIWRECLEFATQLSRWEAFANWVDRVAYLPQLVPVTPEGVVDRKQLERTIEHRREFFEKKIGMYWEDWIGAIDRGIELRRVLSSGGSKRVGRELELKAIIRLLKQRYPQFTQREIAGRVDDFFAKKKRPVPLLNGWKKRGVTSLVEAYDNPHTSSAVKKYYFCYLSYRLCFVSLSPPSIYQSKLPAACFF